MSENWRAIGWGILFVLFMAGGFISPWFWIAAIVWFLCLGALNEWARKRQLLEASPAEPTEPVAKPAAHRTAPPPLWRSTRPR